MGSKTANTYCCAKCNYPFTACLARDAHQEFCRSRLFLDESEPIPPPVIYPTYRELLTRASETNKLYGMYASRKQPGEPDDLKSLYMQLNERRTNGGTSKKERRVYQQPKTGQPGREDSKKPSDAGRTDEAGADSGQHPLVETPAGWIGVPGFN